MGKKRKKTKYKIYLKNWYNPNIIKADDVEFDEDWVTFIKNSKVKAVYPLAELFKLIKL